MARDWDGIYFYLDGKQYAFRPWDRVPRVGETVVFSVKDQLLLVRKVLWRETKESAYQGTAQAGLSRPYAEVELERPTPAQQEGQT